jgi:WD40 repeat protein
MKGSGLVSVALCVAIGLVLLPITASAGGLSTTDGSVIWVVVTPDGSKIVSGSYDHTIKVWNLKTGAFLGRLHGHTKIVTSGAGDKTLKVWNMP